MTDDLSRLHDSMIGAVLHNLTEVASFLQQHLPQ